MEKRVLGIILSILGIAGLIYAGVSFMNGGTGEHNIKAIVFSGVLGAELDDEQEAIGSEDEENNSYSLGGDNHNDLEEGRD